MELSVQVKIKKHMCGNDYCLVEAYASNSIESYVASFSFSLEYLFDYVKEEDRPQFITQVVGHHLNSEVATFHKKRILVMYNVANMNDVLLQTRELRPKVLDS